MKLNSNEKWLIGIFVTIVLSVLGWIEYGKCKVEDRIIKMEKNLAAINQELEIHGYESKTPILTKNPEVEAKAESKLNLFGDALKIKTPKTPPVKNK